MKNDDFGDRMKAEQVFVADVYATFDVEADARNFLKEVHERGWISDTDIDECIDHQPAGVCEKDGPYDEFWDVYVVVNLPDIVAPTLDEMLSLAKPYTDLVLELANDKYKAYHAAVTSMGIGSNRKWGYFDD